MLSARSRKAPTYGVTYVSLEDCTLHFETEYIIERRDGSLAHMPMRTPVSEREALQ
ncbi:type III secretion system co-regulatory protein PtrC, partial [Pseudomonas aeruginosa]